MTQVSPGLRRLFISFNVFFAVVGGLIIVVSLACLSPPLDGDGGRDFEGQTTSHIFLYIVGSVTMATAILGAYGAYKENVVALTVFLVCMVVGGVLMLRVGLPAATAQPELERLIEKHWRSFLPLDQAPDDIKHQVEARQTSLHCCGLFGHEDWEENIPNSCLCHQDEEMEGSCQTVSYSNILMNLFWQKKSVFRQNCFPLIVDAVATNANVTLGVAFTLFVLALLGLLLSSLTIYQMSIASDRPTMPVMMFTDQPPSYQQLYNQPA